MSPRGQNNVVTGTQLSASSPDEEAFVYAGERFGYKFLNRSKDVVTVDIAGRGKAQYRVVAMLPYTQVCALCSLVCLGSDVACACPLKMVRFVLSRMLT